MFFAGFVAGACLGAALCYYLMWQLDLIKEIREEVKDG